MIVPDAETERKILDCGVSRESFARIQTYVQTLGAWQAKVNLVGASTLHHIWTRHILDAVQLLPYLPRQSLPIAELGSGAGIPGLLVAISTGLEVHLYESNSKKCAFLREAARRTAARVVIHNVRLETLSHTAGIPKVSCVLARALAPLSLLLEYAEPFFKQGAIGLFHKGQDVDSELTEATKCWKMKVERHQSLVESDSVILEVKEATHV
jgi:16S rRNA (guanine527-N7)-methyltransferase